MSHYKYYKSTKNI